MTPPRLPVSPSAVPSSKAPYIWAVVVMFLLGTVLIMVICSIRPLIDPLVVVGAIAGFLAPTSAAILALMKAQETHLSVNSRLDTWMSEHGRASRAEGRFEGVLQEQERAAAVVQPQLNAVSPVAVTISAPTPMPVVVVAPEETPKGPTTERESL